MHPEIMRDLVSQHGRELREQAHRATLARIAGRNRRHAAADLEAAAMPAIPDYVDGSFRTAGDEVVSRVPAARRAA
jgi:hypothetical protein